MNYNVVPYGEYGTERVKRRLRTYRTRLFIELLVYYVVSDTLDSDVDVA